MNTRYRIPFAAAVALCAGLVFLTEAACSREGVSPPRKTAQWKLKDSPERPACVKNPGKNVPVLKTAGGIQFVRTPDERFRNLPGYPFRPRYMEIDGLRMHYAEAGPANGEVILLLHGQPSWSYLYRKMIPPLAAAGYRVIAPDLMGLGRSDKPIAIGIHTYEQHVRWMKAFIKKMKLKDITLFAQDWGGLIGLRIVGDSPELFARVVAANTMLMVLPKGKNPFRVPETVRVDCDLAGVKLGDNRLARNIVYGGLRDWMPDFMVQGMRFLTFQNWIRYALTSPDMKPSTVIEFVTNNTLTKGEAAAYDAPYPTFMHKAAIRTLPSMAAGIEEQSKPAWERLGRFRKPFLFLASEQDKNLGSLETQNRLTGHIPGAKGQAHERFRAHHFIQEDIGPVLADRVIRFIKKNPRAKLR